MLLLASLLLATTITTKADVPRLQPAELSAAMAKNDAVALDVRGSVPFELSHITGAVWMPLGLLGERAGTLPEEKLIVAYCTCKEEETSLEAALLLSKLGFPRVAVLRGGFPAWQSAGLPTESNRPSAEGRNASRGGRLAPPAAVQCSRNDLTAYAGSVRHYRRQQGKTTIVIDTDAGTTETVTLRHSGSDDPSRFYLIAGTPFTPSDWNRIERRKGVLRPGMSAVAWVCADGTIIVDWRPATAG